ncbi:MAG: RidA family protein [Dongiaceae bacterium]
MKQITYPDSKSPYAYSKAVRAGDFVFLSGQLALGPDGILIHGGIEAETRQVLQNIKRTLGEVDCTLADVVKVTVWLQDTRDFIGYNKVYSEFFAENSPTRATVRADLMFDCKIEVEVTAYKPLK